MRIIFMTQILRLGSTATSGTVASIIYPGEVSWAGVLFYSTVARWDTLLQRGVQLAVDWLHNYRCIVGSRVQIQVAVCKPCNTFLFSIWHGSAEVWKSVKLELATPNY